MLDTIVQAVFEIGYFGFFCYMIVVGTFIPLPTQLILLPAGYLASQGRLDITIVAIVTAMGTTTGALINYYLSNFISKKFIEPQKIKKLKRFFEKYGRVSVFLAPLSLGLGQYISIPAGITKMDLRWFVPIIFFSNAIWNVAMLMLGYAFGEDASSKSIYIIGSGAVLMIVVISLFVYREFRSY